MTDLYGLHTQDAGPIPLKGVRVEGDILGRGARVRVVQRFKNEEKKAVEAIYRFPLPEGAAVCGFRARIGKRTVEGKVEEREKAFEIYDKALAGGHGAYLLDQERPNIFTLSVGNLKPRQEAVVEIEYVTLLDMVDNSVRFHLPTTISPRYVPDGMPDVDGIPEEDRIHPEYAPDVPYGLTMNLNVHAGEVIEAVESPSHPIKVEMGKRPLSVTFAADSVRMDRDFVLSLAYEAGTPSRAYRYSTNGEAFIQLDFLLGDEPARKGAKTTKPDKRELVFVLDCSGSMMGESIVQAKKALEICLKALEPGTAFNVYRFGSTFESMFEKPVTYDKKTLKKALGYLKHVDADLGGTEILSPLQHIYDGKITRGCVSREIIFITDGEVANEEQVFKLVRAGNAKTRVFAIGIGAGPNDHLIKGIARAGRGASALIYPGERIEPSVMAIFSKVTEPRLVDPVISWGNKDSEQAPGEPVFFGGSPATVCARLKAGRKAEGKASAGKKAGAQGGKLVIKARVNGKSRKWDIDIIDVESPDLPIPALWARERIRDLEGSGGEAAERGSRQTGRKARMIREMIISLSEKYGVLSSLTSYIAIEKRKEKDKATGEIVLRKVPVLVTTGWHGMGSVGRALLMADSMRSGPRKLTGYIELDDTTG
ncbi:MAG: VIT and VWA domain-containing protein, partial [bacterium]